MSESKESNAISNTHEWRTLGEFRPGDTLHRWGHDFPIIRIEHSPGRVQLTYQDGAEKKTLSDFDTAKYIGRKRE